MSLETPNALRLDLHTHPGETALWLPPNLEVAAEVVARIRAAGLDGIAVTEHYDPEYGFGLKAIIEAEFGASAPLILPGHEIYVGLDEVVEIFLPSGLVYRFMPHPRRPERADALAGPIHGIEIANGMHAGEIDVAHVEAVAAELELMILRNSDAHFLRDIGSHHNTLTLESLEEAAAKRPARSWRAPGGKQGWGGAWKC